MSMSHEIDKVMGFTVIRGNHIVNKVFVNLKNNKHVKRIRVELYC
jgi:hypothetical protein